MFLTQLLDLFSNLFCLLLHVTGGGAFPRALSQEEEKKYLGRKKYSLLYVHSSPFLQARKLADSERFNIQFADPGLLQTTGDKLRYYRYKKTLRQSEVAEAEILQASWVLYDTAVLLDIIICNLYLSIFIWLGWCYN